MECDELAFPVPFQVISQCLTCRPTVPTNSVVESTLTTTLEPTTTLEDLDRADVAVSELIPYLRIIEQRRHNLGDDVVSALLTAE